MRRRDPADVAVQTPGALEAGPHPIPTLESRIKKLTDKIHNPEHPSDDQYDQLAQLVAMSNQANIALITKITNLTELLMSQALNGVLEVRTAKFGATSGIHEYDSRAPFAGVTIVNATGALITCTNSGHEISAPTTGAGVLPVQDGAALTLPISGTHLTFYGTPGATFTYVVWAKAIDAAAGASKASGTLAGDTAQALNVAVGIGATVPLAAPNAQRNNLLVVNTSTTAAVLYVGYDVTGATNAIPITPGEGIQVKGGVQLYATNPAAQALAGFVSYMAD